MKTENELLILGIDNEIKQLKSWIKNLLNLCKENIDNPKKLQDYIENLNSSYQKLSEYENLKRSKSALYDIDSDTNFSSDDIPF